MLTLISESFLFLAFIEVVACFPFSEVKSFLFWDLIEVIDLWCSVPEIVFLPLLGVRVVGRDVGNDQKAAYFPFLEVVQCDL